MRIAQIGNFVPPHSTENDLLRAMRSLNHEVIPMQENDLNVWRSIHPADYDAIVWTRTGWTWAEYGLTEQDANAMQRVLLDMALLVDTPVIGVHLDRWWGLNREHQVESEPFFQCNFMFTADGGHDEEWKRANVNHFWFPPGVSQSSCHRGKYREEFASDIAFVGSWQDYHQEWTHRFALVEHMKARWGSRCAFWPRAGQHAIRGEDLNDLYASVKVLVGDSCLVGECTHYCSDRLPETMGRGGFLVHPWVKGITDGTLWDGGVDLGVWELGHFDDLDSLIEAAIRDDGERNEIAAHGQKTTIAKHTYEKRMRAVFQVVFDGKKSII